MSQITKPAENSRRNNHGDRPRRERKQQEEAPWIPKTILGKKVASGEITSLEEIIQNGRANGQSTRFKALVAAGNQNGWLGIGLGKSKQMRIAIEKANNAAFLNVVPVKLGCGSWECRCNFCHSVPFTVKGKAGSVTIEILPAPKGLGLVAGGKIRNLLKLAGVKHAWTRTTGSTATMSSTSKALLECLRQTWSQG